MSTKDRTIVLYYMGITLYKGRNVPDNYDLITELHKTLKYIKGLDEQERKVNFKRQNKILYLEKYEKDSKWKNYNLTFVSAKYNQVREVIDTETLTSKGILKKKKDGDIEKNHITISFEDKNNAVIAFECNYQGVGMTKIASYLNDMANRYYAEKGDTKFYRFDVELIPNNDFLQMLEKAKKISMATFVIDKEYLDASEFQDLAKRKDIRDEIEIVVKPTGRGHSIMRNTVKDYHSKKKKNNKIKRIYLKGESEKGKLSIDTEQMKTRHTVYVDSDVNGVVKANSIFNELNGVLTENSVNGDD